ncbi:MAG: PEP-utilizing enzyme, partial [bacterium]
MSGISDPIRGATEPTRCWTLTNVSEATPDVLSPLCWSVWSECVELGARGAWFDFGILPGREVRHTGDPNRMITACFFGRQAMNVDLCRTLMAGIPGTTADDFERDILGSVRPDAPPVPNSWRRLPFIAAKTPVVLATQSRRIRRLHDEQVAWWRSQVLDRSQVGDPKARLAEASRRFGRAMRIHVRTRFLVQGLQSQVVALATRAGAPALAARLLGGMGNVAETALVDDTWLVGRGQLDRAEFLRRHGYHGTNEGNVIGRSWREEPAVVD